MDKFRWVLYTLKQNRDIYMQRIEYTKEPKVREFLKQRADEYNEAISIIKAENNSKG